MKTSATPRRPPDKKRYRYLRLRHVTHLVVRKPGAALLEFALTAGDSVREQING